MSSKFTLRLLAGAVGAVSFGSTATHAFAANPGGLYETFAGVETVGINLDHPYAAIGFHSGNATNITAGGGKVYWEDGANIYQANSDLSGASIWHVNGIAPTDIAVDAQAGVLYETFAGNEVVGISLANPYTAVGFYSGNAGRITAGGGHVYWTDGANIYQANSDLSGAGVWHVNGIAATDIAVDASAGALYETFAGVEAVAISLAHPYQALGFYSGNATQITAGDGTVFWEDGANIYKAAADLSGAAVWHVNGIAPTDLAYLPPEIVRGVPEPATWAMMIGGFGLSGVSLRRRRALAA